MPFATVKLENCFNQRSQRVAADSAGSVAKFEKPSWSMLIRYQDKNVQTISLLNETKHVSRSHTRQKWWAEAVGLQVHIANTAKSQIVTMLNETPQYYIDSNKQTHPCLEYNLINIVFCTSTSVCRYIKLCSWLSRSSVKSWIGSSGLYDLSGQDNTLSVSCIV